MYGSAAVSWASKKQPTVALSSCEAEIVAASEATRPLPCASSRSDTLTQQFMRVDSPARCAANWRAETYDGSAPQDRDTRPGSSAWYEKLIACVRGVSPRHRDDEAKATLGCVCTADRRAVVLACTELVPQTLNLGHAIYLHRVPSAG
eukprot:3858140-Pleurochrysis_carterae.AAC.1